MIHVIASVEVVPGRRDDFLSIFRDNVPNVLSEDGCLEYAPVVDLPTGISAQRPRDDVVTVIEKWRDLAALEAHLLAPHMAAYRQRVHDVVRNVELRVLQPAD